MTDLSPASSADDRGSLSAQLRHEDVLDAFEAAWRSGPRPALLVYLERGPVDKRSELLGELLSLDFDYRRRAGETPRVEDYAAVPPQFLAELQMFFATRKPSQTPSGHATRSGSDRNLLFGILALEMDFVGRDALVDALRDWTTQKDKPLGQILVERGDLSAARRELLEPLIDEHVRRHNNDPAASLASISSVVEGDVDWNRLQDADISASLAGRRRTRNEPRTEGAAPTLPREVANPALRFRVLRPHARGGIGEVFVALDQELNREVALKEIQSQHVLDDSFRERFVREAEVTGGLEHPGIVPVYSLGHYGDGRPFYAMRFIRGDSLKEAIEKFHAACSTNEPPALRADINAHTVIGAVPQEAQATAPAPGHREQLVSSGQFASIAFRKLLGRFIDVCQAIEYAHSRGVLHRDLKPGNIMLGKYGETLVVDWGLAKIAGKDDRFANVDESTLVPSSGSGIENTADGSVIGTPAYMSPEQAAGRLDQLGPATDVYSLGATLYHVLTGRSPFAKLPLPELLARVQRGDFPRPRELNSSIPKPLEAICLRAMALQPDHRYESAAAIAEDIEHWLADEPVNAHREDALAQGSRWFRKHRAWTMSGAAALAIVAIVATIAALLIKGQNNVIAEQKRAATKLANEKSALAERETTAREKADLSAADALRQTKLGNQRLYVAHMNLAQAAWEGARAGQTIRLLDLYQLATGEDGGSDDLRGFEWFYWDRLCHSDLLTLKGHTSWVLSVAFSPDGQRLASASWDGTAKVWDMATGQVLLTLKEHASGVTSVVFSADGQRLASSSRDGTVMVYDAATGQVLLTLNGHAREVNSVAFSPDGKRLVSASWDQTVKVWDAATGHESFTLKGHTGPVLSVAFSPNARWLASASDDKTVKVWDAATGHDLLTLTGHTNGVSSVAFSPDGQRLVSASGDQTVKVWDAATGHELLTLKGHTASVQSVVFSPDGQRLASASGDQTVKVWDAGTGDEWFTLKGHTDAVISVAFSPDGKLLASASWDQTVKVWDAATDQGALTLRGHTASVQSVVFSPDGQRLASASGNLFNPGEPGEVIVWDAATGHESRTLKGHTKEVSSVAFSPDGQRLASASWDQTVKLWDTDTGQELLTLNGHAHKVTCVAFSPDGQRLASASGDQTVKLWDVDTGQELFTLKGHTASVQGVAFSPDGQRLASASVDQTAKVWDTATGQQSLTLNGHTKEVWSVAFSPDGQQLASASHDQTIKVWDAVTGQEALTFHGHTNEVNSVAFSPNGQRLASASWDHTVKVWHVGTGHELLTLKGHTWSVVSVAFSPDSQRLASASYDGTVKLWDASPDARSESNALERAVERMEREAQTALARHRKTMATYEELQTALHDDQTISTAVRNKALELATELVSLDTQTPVSPNAIADDLSSLRQLSPYELLYFRSNRTIGAQQFDDAKVSTFSTVWLDDPLLIAKPKTRSVFVLCKNRLFELVADEADRPRELRRFPQHVHDLAFHPTEDRIAWCRRADPNAAPELIVSRVDGSDEENLGFGYDPVWTADGEKLLYVRAYTGATEDGWFIGIREGTQTRRIKVPVHPSIHVYPCPAPDGNQIAFSMKGEDGTMQIGLTSLDGKDIRQLTRTGDFNTKPAFSPDGKYLAFIRGQQPTTRLIIVNVETGKETVISEDAQPSRPVWITNPQRK